MNNNENIRQASNVKLGWGERSSYAAGTAGTYILLTIVNSMLTIYLTNVVHLDIAIVTSIMAASALLDGISDLIAGGIIDRTNSRFGKARIWIIRCALPITLSVFFLFQIPESMSENAKYIYVFIFYNLFITCFFTITSISLNSLVSLLTSNGKEQSFLGVIRVIGETVGMTMVSMFFVKLLPVFSNDQANPSTQSGYTGAVGVYCLLSLVLLLIAGFFTRERVKGKNTDHIEKVNLLENIKALLHNKYWLMLALIAFLITTVVQSSMTSAAYFATYVLGDLDTMSWLMTSITMTTSIFLFITPFFLIRLGKRNSFILGLLIQVVGALGAGLFAPNHIPVLVSCIILGAGRAIGAGIEPGLLADAIRYTEHKTGVFSAGLGNSGFIAARKLGVAASSIFMGVVLSLSGFSAANEAQGLPQPAGVSTGVTWVFSYAPALLTLVVAIFFALFFHLEKELAEIEKE